MTLLSVPPASRPAPHPRPVSLRPPSADIRLVARDGWHWLVFIPPSGPPRDIACSQNPQVAQYIRDLIISSPGSADWLNASYPAGAQGDTP